MTNGADVAAAFILRAAAQARPPHTER
jgi:hypothetical protein